MISPTDVTHQQPIPDNLAEANRISAASIRESYDEIVIEHRHVWTICD